MYYIENRFLGLIGAKWSEKGCVFDSEILGE